MCSEETVIVVLNVTTPDGELLGRVELTASELLSDSLTSSSWIKQQIVAELPSGLLGEASP